MLGTVIVIPARYGSTRFPGKPLALIRGKSLLYRTWSIAKSVHKIDEVYIATDDSRIEQHATKFGAKVEITDTACRNGTERTLQALANVQPKPEIVINLQGDALLTPPWVVEALVDALLQDPAILIATAAVRLSLSQYEDMIQQKAQGNSSGTLVTFDQNHRALYFSKSLIPFVRDQTSSPPVYRHIGIYGFRYPMLEKYVHLTPTPLEEAEGLEQLRVLEHGIPMQVVEVGHHKRTLWSVDTPEDTKIAESIIDREGELLDAAVVSERSAQ